MAASIALHRGYAICATPRSGSNYLCRLLGSTGALGRPLEWLDADAVHRTGFADWPRERAAQLARIRVDGASPNGVWGLKLFASHFDFASPARWAEQLPGLRTWIWLTRRDLLGQAISLVRARQTNVWHVLDIPAGEPRFDAEAIDSGIAEICACDAQWRAWFARYGVNVLPVAYEDLRTTAETAILAEIAGRLEVPGTLAPDDRLIDVKRQRDELSDSWRASYLAARGVPARERFADLAL